MTTTPQLIGLQALPARVAGACCGLALILLLLLQPVMCVLHCALTPSDQHQGAGAGGHFVCRLPAPAPATPLSVPPFWPGALPALALFVAAVVPLRQLCYRDRPGLSSQRWAPPLRPPRPLLAA